MKLFAVYDRKSETYDRPMFFKTVAEAIRAFELAITSDEKDSMFSMYRADFEFHYLGELEITNGYVDCNKNVVCVGSDYLKDPIQHQLPLEVKNGKKS